MWNFCFRYFLGSAFLDRDLKTLNLCTLSSLSWTNKNTLNYLKQASKTRHLLKCFWERSLPRPFWRSEYATRPSRHIGSAQIDKMLQCGLIAFKTSKRKTERCVDCLRTQWTEGENDVWKGNWMELQITSQRFPSSWWFVSSLTSEQRVALAINLIWWYLRNVWAY